MRGENAKRVPVPLCLPQIPHGMAWRRTPGLFGEKTATGYVSDGTTFLINTGSFILKK